MTKLIKDQIKESDASSHGRKTLNKVGDLLVKNPTLNSFVKGEEWVWDREKGRLRWGLWAHGL